MSSDIVTPRMRVHAWNLHLLAGPDKELFGGLYVPPENTTLRFRDIVDEIRLCFELPEDTAASDEETSDAWGSIAFGHADCINFEQPPIPPGVPVVSMYRDGQLNQVLHGLRTTAENSYPMRPPIVRFYVVRHKKCHLSTVEPLEAHLKAGCATHLPYPSLRCDERNLPGNSGPMNPASIQSIGSLQLSSHRLSSSSSSPSNGAEPESRENGHHEEVDVFSTPPTSDMTFGINQKTMATFIASCYVTSTQCAVTGKGRSWYVTPAIGPGMHACHIVPPHHFHVYPVPGYSESKSRYSAQHLREAWNRTWSANNGIMLFSHLHEFFDARLFSVHPETLRIRVFVPYDVLLEYHDVVAQLPPNIDRKALRHHYEMCCIENMSAEMLLTEQQPAYKAERELDTIQA